MYNTDMFYKWFCIEEENNKWSPKKYFTILKEPLLLPSKRYCGPLNEEDCNELCIMLNNTQRIKLPQ